jgi:uncharacterized protein (TIGR00730 family)
MPYAVTVFCSARDSIDRAYFTVASDLGTALANNGWTLVFGGNNIGLMGALADSCRSAGGRVVGITPQLMVDEGISDQQCDELIVTSLMGERKHLLQHRGDAIVVLPGGLGTFEEFFETLVGRQLGYHEKPIVILNVDGFFDPLLAMLDHGMNAGFIRRASRRLYHVSTSVAETIDYLHNFCPTPAGVDPAAEAE